jgi:hypothetical protein
LSGKSGLTARLGRWDILAGRRLGVFALAILCGVAVPLSPLLGEFYVTGAITNASWSAVGITYAAGVGLVSRSPMILVGMLVLAAFVSFIYGVDMKDAYDHLVLGGRQPMHPSAVLPVKSVIAGAIVLYVSERSAEHLRDGQPVLEV